jgi:CAAX protease family protein
MNDDFALPDVDEAQDLNREAAGTEPAVIDEVEFVSGSPEPASRPPGPGLPEALLWTLGVLVVMLGASGVWGLLFALYLVADGHPITPGMSVEALMEGLPVNTRIMLLLPPSLLAFVVLIPLGLLRLGRRRLGKLNLSPPSLTQLLIVLAAVYPTTIISTPMFGLADEAWTSFSKGNPVLEEFNEQSSVMGTVEKYFQHGSLPLLLFLLAVVPAVGEEFMFRGIIGRGLTARWGLRGVLMTSCLFACVHLYPPHIVAVLPIGIMLHIVYLSTRSYWAPVLFHFCNNAMAASFVALGVETDEKLAWWMPVVALAYLAVSIVLLYRYRTRYVNDEGEEVSPGYLTVEQPPPESGARRFAPPGRIVAPFLVFVLTGTVLYIAHDVAASGDAQPEVRETETSDLNPEPDAYSPRIASWGSLDVRPESDPAGPAHLGSDCRNKT